ncbi:ATP-binding cassette domain-containing protein [Paenibacillus massiliensis]|uniref:ABC transporter ATP-binding protein n=1 Tax=Paenibacillus massiliensis TaxID=225917 RepID=UPI00036A9A93|nr:ATP-binding cassette domain-containing protein [Paenibacillus massiliensis]
MPQIEVEHLTKTFRVHERGQGIRSSFKTLFKPGYKDRTVVNNLSFCVNKGEMVGYLGPNGAGKSTTIKMLTGILVPTAGSILVNGMIPHKNRIQNASKIGVVFGQRTQLWWDIPVSESIELMKYMYKIPDIIFKSNLEMFNEILGLQEFIHIPVRHLSLGQRMRADLCCALLHNPEIIFLDEPTIGLDVVVKQSIREFIREVNRLRQVTLLLTTHDIDDIEALCKRVIVIDQGSIMFDGSISKLKEAYNWSGNITAKVKDDCINQELLKRRFGEAILSEAVDNGKLVITYDKSKVLASEIAKEVLNQFEVEDITFVEAELEDIIRELYRGAIKR